MSGVGRSDGCDYHQCSCVPEWAYDAKTDELRDADRALSIFQIRVSMLLHTACVEANALCDHCQYVQDTLDAAHDTRSGSRGDN